MAHSRGRPRRLAGVEVVVDDGYDPPDPASVRRLPDAGWYPDPGGVPAWRWWDGSGWTEQMSASGQPHDEPTGRRPAVSRRTWTVGAGLVVLIVVLLAVRATSGPSCVELGIEYAERIRAGIATEQDVHEAFYEAFGTDGAIPARFVVMSARPDELEFRGALGMLCRDVD